MDSRSDASLPAGSLGAPDPVEFTQTQSAVDRFQQGDERAFDEIWRRYTPAIELLIATRVRPKLEPDLKSRIEANDLLQDVALEVHTGLGQFTYRGPGSILAWITTILMHVVSDRIAYWRAQGRNPVRERDGNVPAPARRIPLAQLRHPGSSPVTEAGTAELRRLVGTALAQLAERHQTIVIWKFFGGASWQEITAAVGGGSPDAVRMEFSGKILPLLARLIPHPE
jgi:RNA polymerase sigma factor (sigma-70 family)